MTLEKGRAQYLVANVTRDIDKTDSVPVQGIGPGGSTHSLTPPTSFATSA